MKVSNLFEDNVEQKDLENVALYIEKFATMPRGDYYWPQNSTLTFKDIYRFRREKINIKSSMVFNMLFSGYSDSGPLKFKASRTLPAFGSYGSFNFEILFNLENLEKNNKQLASTLIHELQHALDDYKSSGKAIPPGGNMHLDYQTYVTQPHEINARFAQALLTLAKLNTPKNELLPVISQVFKTNSLSKKIVGEKQYQRLTVRAYKFMDEFKLIEPNKIGFKEKVKQLIRKWIKL